MSLFLLALLLQVAGQSNIESTLKGIVRLHPDSFDANYNLGEFYLHSGRIANGIPYMEKAQSLNPTNYISGYDLALAYFDIKAYAKARGQIQGMLRQKDAAELHSLLADVEEGAGNYVAAAGEYQRAARLEPTEEHIFDWGSELLTHRAAEAANDVFERGTELFPRSAKLRVGLGIALYMRGNYDESVKALCLATDLQPSASWPYVFLGKMYHISTASADEARKRLSRFAELQPKNPQALYFYAMSLWERDENAQPDFPKLESLLRRAVDLDPKYAEAHLQLGILFADQTKYAEAIREFQRTIQLRPDLTTAHYHLAQCYRRTGDKALAEGELRTFEGLRKHDQAESENERKEITQFIVTMKEQTPSASAK